MKNLKNKIKNMKGITLISLVVTIIILLILAGITINTLMNNGLFEKAKEAKDKWQNAQDDEETQIAKYTNEINSYVDGNRDTSSKNNYKSDGTEIITNDLLDDKPIYAKYFQITLSTNQWIDVPHNITNVDTIWIDFGNSYVLSSDDYKYVLPVGGGGCTYRVNSANVGSFSSSGWGGSTAYLLLKYTKTTPTQSE